MNDLLFQLSRTFESSDKAIPAEIVMLLLILGLLIFMWDLFERRSRIIKKETGLDEKAEMISLKGSSYLPSRDYVSTQLGLSARPYALVRDGDHLIPVDYAPTSKKVHDRHVVALLVHMRLIEEKEGSKPPYGLLILGTEARPVKILNKPEKQRWLDSLLDEMNSIIDGVPAVPAPSKFKCKNCDVRQLCRHSAYREQEIKFDKPESGSSQSS